MVSGTQVIIGKDLFEYHSWTMGIVLIVTIGLGLLGCVCCVRSAPTNWNCTCDKRTRGCTAANRHDFEKHANEDHQPLEREDVASLKVFWRSAGAADDVEQAEVVWQAGTVLGGTLPS